MANNELKRSVSTMDVLFLSMGAMLGWGWVILSGEWVNTAGFLGASIAFAGGGFLMILIGLTYAELATAMPESGGGVVFVLRAYGSKLGFFAGWSVLFGYVSVIAFEAVALPTVIDYITPVEHKVFLWSILGSDVYLTWALIGVVGSVIIGILNYIGIRMATLFQSVFTIAIVAVGLLLVFGAFSQGDVESLKPLFKNGSQGLISVLIMVPFMLVGFDVIPQIASEIKKPEAIGTMLIVSIVSAIIFYILIIYGVSIGLTPEQLSTTQLATADAMANIFNSPLFGKILVIGGIAGIITSWNAFIIGASRILYAMAIRNMLPQWFTKIHPKYNTPSNAIIFLTLSSMFAPFLGRSALVWLVNAGGIGIVMGYLIVTIAFLKLRKSEPDMPRPYTLKFPNLIGYTAVILSIGFLILYLPGMPAQLESVVEWGLVFGWYGLGAILMLAMISGRRAVSFD